MITAVHEAIKVHLRTALPGLQEVYDYGHTDELKAPCAVVNLMHMEPADEPDDGTERLWVECTFEIFLALTADTPNVTLELQRMASAVAFLVNDNRFGQQVAPAIFKQAGPNEFEPTFSGADAWRVEFEIGIPLGQSVWDGKGIPVTQVMASYSPVIGAAHEEDYMEVAGDELQSF